jgi:hypothetical protein
MIFEGLMYIAGSIDNEDTLDYFEDLMVYMFGEDDKLFKKMIHKRDDELAYNCMYYVSTIMGFEYNEKKYYMKSSPKDFGPYLWKMMFVCASLFDEDDFVTFVKVYLPNLLPCYICGNHWLQHMKNHPPNNVATKRDRIKYIYDMKNIVDYARNGKKYVPNFDLIYREYRF